MAQVLETTAAHSLSTRLEIIYKSVRGSLVLLTLALIQSQRDSGSTPKPSEKQPDPTTNPVIYGLVPTDFFSFANMSDGGNKKSSS